MLNEECSLLEDNINSDFCVCGQIKHVGYDMCIDCLENEKLWDEFLESER